MSKLRLLSIAVIGLTLINLAIVGFLLVGKPPHPPEGGPSKEGPKQVIIDRLNLNAQQITEYDKLISSHRVSMNALEDSIGLMKNNLYQTLNDESSTGKDAMINRLGEIQKQIEWTNYNHFVSLKKLCRPDQLDQFNQLTTELAHFFAKKNDTPPPPKD